MDLGLLDYKLAALKNHRGPLSSNSLWAYDSKYNSWIPCGIHLFEKLNRKD